MLIRDILRDFTGNYLRPQVLPPLFTIFSFRALLCDNGSDAGTDLSKRLLEESDLFLFGAGFGTTLETLELLLDRSELLLRLRLVH